METSKKTITIQEAYNLNENEMEVLNSLIGEAMLCTSGEFGYMEDVERGKFTKHSFAGYVSQLKQKGCFEYIDSEFNGQYALKEEIISDFNS